MLSVLAMDIVRSAAQQGHGNGNCLPRVAIIIVHFERIEHTIECIQSVMLSDYKDCKLIICDNGSAIPLRDDLVEWANSIGQESSINVITNSNIVRSNDALSERITIIRCNHNLGYAAGANLGFRLALKDRVTKYVWLLNNDVIVKPNCLRHMVSRSESVQNAGICGSRCIYYNHPDKIQALGGGKFFRWSGRSALIGNMSPASAVVNERDVEQELDYVFGASMLVSRSFLESVGLLSEEYFIFHEEIDWAIRGRDRWAFLYSHDAILFHKGGGTVGSGTSLATTSPLAAFYMLRSRLILTRKFFPLSLASVWGFNALRAMRALALGYPSLSRALAAALCGLRYEGCALPNRSGRRSVAVPLRTFS